MIISVPKTRIPNDYRPLAQAGRPDLEVRRALLDRALAEMDNLGIPLKKQYDWIMDNCPMAVSPPAKGGSPLTYIVYNSARCTTAAPVKQATGTAIRTMMQISPSIYIRIIEWGASFDGSAAATPGQIELVDTGTVIASGSNISNYVVADIQTYSNYNAPANTAGNSGGTAGAPLYIGTSTTYVSAYTTGAPTEGSTTATRMADMQMLPPTGPYVKQWPLGREFEMPAGNTLRVRNTFGTSVNAYYYIIFEC